MGFARLLQCLDRVSLSPLVDDKIRTVCAYGLSNNNNGDGGCGWYQPIVSGLANSLASCLNIARTSVKYLHTECVFRLF